MLTKKLAAHEDRAKTEAERKALGVWQRLGAQEVMESHFARHLEAAEGILHDHLLQVRAVGRRYLWWHWPPHVVSSCFRRRNPSGRCIGSRLLFCYLAKERPFPQVSANLHGKQLTGVDY